MSHILIPNRLGIRIIFAACLFFPLFASGETPQKALDVEAGHMRYKNHDSVLPNSIAWQEERNGHWVTIVLSTDRPVPKENIYPGKQPSQIMEEVGVQGVAVAIMSGGIPMQDNFFDVGYRDGDKINTATVNGSGGINVEIQSATRIKGSMIQSPFTLTKKNVNDTAWSVNFDAPVLFGDIKRMEKEGTMLGIGGGQPGKDMLATQQAMLAMDYNALLPYVSPELASQLKEPSVREKILKGLKESTSPQISILGGLQNGDSAIVYWVAHWPNALDNRCVSDLKFKDEIWYTNETSCQSE